MMRMVRGAQNPRQMMEEMAGQNPNVKNMMELVKTSGRSPKDLFYTLAKQRGVDPDEILRQLQS